MGLLAQGVVAGGLPALKIAADLLGELLRLELKLQNGLIVQNVRLETGQKIFDRSELALQGTGPAKELNGLALLLVESLLNCKEALDLVGVLTDNGAGQGSQAVVLLVLGHGLTSFGFVLY